MAVRTLQAHASSRRRTLLPAALLSCRHAGRSYESCGREGTQVICTPLGLSGRSSASPAVWQRRGPHCPGSQQGCSRAGWHPLPWDSSHLLHRHRSCRRLLASLFANHKVGCYVLFEAVSCMYTCSRHLWLQMMQDGSGWQLAEAWHRSYWSAAIPFPAGQMSQCQQQLVRWAWNSLCHWSKQLTMTDLRCCLNLRWHLTWQHETEDGGG